MSNLGKLTYFLSLEFTMVKEGKMRNQRRC